MATNDQEQVLAPVEQIDRDAAADYTGSEIYRTGGVDGKLDHTPLVQAFAQHRLAAFKAGWDSAFRIQDGEL